MIDADRAADIEARLAAFLEVPTKDVRDYLRGNVRAGGGRTTGIRFVRGTHSGSYVRDPEGTDIVPAGWEEPSH